MVFKNCLNRPYPLRMLNQHSKHTLLSFSSLSRQFYVLPAIATLQMTFCIIYLSYRYLYVRYTSANDTSVLLLKLITVWNKSSNFISNRMLIIKRKRYCLTFFDLITYRIEVRVKSIFLRKRNEMACKSLAMTFASYLNQHNRVSAKF